MPGRRKIILHPGFPKTGTTTIQRQISIVRSDILARHGILVPELDSNLTDSLCTMFMVDPVKHITNAVRRFSKKDLAFKKSKLFDCLEGEIARQPWKTLILSAEGVVNLSAEELRRLKEWGDRFDVDWKIVFTVRGPVDWVRSAIQELMKGGRTLAELYSDIPMPYFRDAISRAIRIFGRDSVDVLSFESGCRMEGGIFAQFLNYVGVTNYQDYTSGRPDVRDNASMSYEAVMILDRLNAMRPLFDDSGRMGRRRTGSEIYHLLRIKGAHFTLPVHVERQILEECADDQEWLRENFSINRSHRAQSNLTHTGSTINLMTAQSLALLLSDLINETEHERALQEIYEAREKHDLVKVDAITAFVQRLMPMPVA